MALAWQPTASRHEIVQHSYVAHLLHFGVADDASCVSLGRGPFEVADQVTLCRSGNTVSRARN